MKLRLCLTSLLLALAAVLAACGQPAGADYLPATAVPPAPAVPAAPAAPASEPAPPAPAQGASLSASLSPETVSVKGDADAPLRMIEFSDYECPFCSRYVSQTLPQIMAQYVDSGKVRYEFRDFPLTSIHPQAQLAAEAARCAGAQGNYWGMHDQLFVRQQLWQGDDAAARTTFSTIARELSLDSGAFNTCLLEAHYAPVVQQHLAEGQQLGVTGTPSFIIGEQFLAGAQPFEVFQQVIEQELARIQQ